MDGGKGELAIVIAPSLIVPSLLHSHSILTNTQILWEYTYTRNKMQSRITSPPSHAEISSGTQVHQELRNKNFRNSGNQELRNKNFRNSGNQELTESSTQRDRSDSESMLTGNPIKS